MPLFSTTPLDDLSFGCNFELQLAVCACDRCGGPISNDGGRFCQCKRKRSRNIPGVGKVTIHETNYAGKTSGSQVITSTSGQSGSSATLPAATTLVVGSTLYFNANAEFWSSVAGFSDAQSNLVAQKWVQIPTSSSLYGKASADLTMPSLTKDLFHAKTYHKGGVRTVNGIRSIAITYMNGGRYDPGRAIAYVALGGKHLPVSVTIGNLPFQLGSWGVAKAIAAPQGSVPLSSLLTSPAT